MSTRWGTPLRSNNLQCWGYLHFNGEERKAQELELGLQEWEGCGGANLFPSYRDTGETFGGVSAGMSQRCSEGKGSPESSSIRALSPHGLEAGIHLLKQSSLLNRSKSHPCISAGIALMTSISNNSHCWSLFSNMKRRNSWQLIASAEGRWEVSWFSPLCSLGKDKQAAHWGQPGPRGEVSSRRLEGPCLVGFDSTLGTWASFDMKK